MRFLIILLVSAPLLNGLSTKQFLRKRSVAQKKSKKISPSQAFVRASVTGDKSKVSRAIKRDLKVLGLGHILTPSGLHFSSLFAFVNLIFFFLKRNRKILQLGLLTIPFFFPELYSMKRIAMMIFLSKVGNISIYKSFWMVFAFDFIFGSYEQSPWSFTFSFLFLGIIVSTNIKSIRLFLYLMAGHLLIGIIIPQLIHPHGLFIGFILTALFSITFPFIGFSHFYPNFISEKVIAIFLKLISFLSKTCQTLGGVVPNAIDLLLIISFVLLKEQRRVALVCLFLLIRSEPLLNSPLSSFNLARKGSPNKILFPGEGIQSFKRNKNGFTINSKAGRKCRYRLLGYRYQRRCKF